MYDWLQSSHNHAFNLKKCKFYCEKNQNSKTKFIFFSCFFSRFESLNYSGMCVKRTNQWKNRTNFFPFFSSNIWSVHMTQRNSSLAENNDHYGELHVRIWKKKKNTSSIWCFIQIIDSHRTIKYNETSASHSCAEKTSRNKSQESERMKDRTTPSDFS